MRMTTARRLLSARLECDRTGGRGIRISNPDKGIEPRTDFDPAAGTIIGMPGRDGKRENEF